MIEREIRYQEQRRKIDLQPFLHKRAGEFQDALFQKVGMMIYGMERCEIVGTNGSGDHQKIILGNEEQSSYSAKLSKILEDSGIAPEEITYIELFDRLRDENGNVIKENPRIADYNQYLVNKSADEYDRYFDDMIEHQSSQMYNGIDTVLTRIVGSSTLSHSHPQSTSIHTQNPIAALQELLQLSHSLNGEEEGEEDQEEEIIEQQESILNLVNAITQSSLHNTFLHQSMVGITQLELPDPSIGEIPMESGGGEWVPENAENPSNPNDEDRPHAPEPTEETERAERAERVEEVSEEQVYEEQVYEDDGNLEPMPSSFSNPFQPTILESRLLGAILNPFNSVGLSPLTRSTSITESPLSPVVPSFFPSRFYTFNIPTSYNSDTFASQLGQQIGQQMQDIKVTLSAAEYDEIPSKTFGECSSEEQEGQPICIICSDNFTEEDRVKITKCHHIIHDGCLRPWLLKESKKCPVCRCELAKGIAHIPSGDEEEEEKEDDP